MKLPEPTERPTITVAEAGAVLGLSRSASYGAARAGAIPTLRFGRRLLVPTHQLRGMLGMPEGGESTAETHGATGGATLDPILRRAIVAGLETFLQVLKSGGHD